MKRRREPRKTGRGNAACRISPELRRQYETYLSRSAKWKQERRGKIVVFRNGRLRGTFDSRADALKFAVHKLARRRPGQSRFAGPDSALDGVLIHRVGDEDKVHCTTGSLLGLE